jgi:hypothetical protein
MKYLCLIYDEEKKPQGRSRDESDAFMGEYFAFTEDIERSGYDMIEARDLNDAIQVASKIPSVKIGSVEVRPVMVFEQP